MASLSQIRSLTRTYISQTDTTNTDFSDDTLNGFINEGVRFLGAIVKKPIDHVDVQVEVNTPAYTLPTDAVLLLTAYFGDASSRGDVIPLQIVTEEALRAVYPNWLDETSNTSGRPRYATLIDMSTVLITPKPNTAESATGKKLSLGYVYQPTVLANDSDTPQLPVVYHDLVSQYASQMCYFSKLNKPELGAAILNQVVEKAKKLEDLIVKDVQSFGFSWGYGIDPNEDGVVVNP